MRRADGVIVDVATPVPGVRVLGVALDPPLAFEAGQYAALSFRGGPWRDYSMANVPGAARLEFHVREEAGGGVSRMAVREARVGEAVRVAGPFGAAHLRATHPGAILAVGGGTGLAPMLSIAETALRTQPHVPVRLYFGVRRLGDVYAEARLDALARQWLNFAYVIALSEETAPGHRRGTLAEVLAEDLRDGHNLTAYLAGPPAMVESVTAILQARGVAAIHADPFVTEAERKARAARGEGPAGREDLD